MRLFEHKLNLGNFVVPSSAAQETQQSVIDGEGLFLLTQQAMRFSRFLAELSTAISGVVQH